MKRKALAFELAAERAHDALMKGPPLPPAVFGSVMRFIRCMRCIADAKWRERRD